MRRLGRNRAQAEEEESVFVTMTDMTISFLLIIMILLAFFATQISDDETVPISVYDPVRDERDLLLDENAALTAQVEDLLTALAEARSDLDRVTVDRDRLRDENEELQGRITELEEEIRRQTALIDQLLDENAALTAQVEGLLTALAQARSDLDWVTADRDRLSDENEELQGQITELEEEIRRLLEAPVVNPLEAYLSLALVQRREILVELRDRLRVEFPDLQVVVSPEQDALRFQGEGLFESGSSVLEDRQRAIVRTMGRLLDEILVCFTLGERATRDESCESGNALIEAVQIEGHTDSDGSDENNLRLSTDRANATLLVMFDEERTILDHLNLRGQPVMSVSGYGEMRPIETNETTEGKAANRRIDLRIIMYAPSTVEEVEEVGRRLDALRDAGGVE